MQRNNTYDIAKCWAIVSVIVYHVINIIFYNQIIHSFIDTYFLALFFFISGLLVKDDKVKCKGWLKMKAVQLLIPFICIFIFNRLYYHFLEGSSIWSQKSIDDSKLAIPFPSSFIVIMHLSALHTAFISTFSASSLQFCTILIKNINSITAKILVLISPFFIVTILCSILPYEIAGYFSLMSFRRYWLFFVYGYIVNSYWKVDTVVLRKVLPYSSLCYITMSLYYIFIVKDISSNFDFAIWFVTNFVGCHFWLLLIERFKVLFSKNIILNIGRSTLGIYLFHYYPLRWCTIAMGGKQLNDSFYYYPLTIICTLVILVLAYFITTAVKSNKITAFLFLGIKAK